MAPWSGSPSAAGPRLGERRATASLWLVALASGVGAALAQAHPTASGASDAVLLFGFGAGVAAAAARSGPVAWLVAASALTLTAAGGWVAVGAMSMALSVAWALRRDPPWPRTIGALVGAAVVQGLLRLPPDHTALHVGATTVAVGCLVAASWPTTGDRARRLVRGTLVVVGCFAGLATAGLIVSLVLARADLERGASRAQRGLHNVRAGRSVRAAQLLDGASVDFASAQTHLDAWWAQPSRLVPVIGQHARALDLLSAAGAELTGSAALSARSARIEDLEVTDGRLDLDRVRAVAAPLAEARSALQRAGREVAPAHSPWLVWPVAGRLREFDRDLSSASFDAATAAQAIDVLPDLLGGDGTRYYFVVFGTPAEARDLGGFMGAFAILKADGGKLSLHQTGRVRDLNLVSKNRTLSDRSVLPAHLLALQPERFWQNVSGTADFPAVAETVRQMWPEAAPVQLDGALYMDPQTLAALLDLTGPIRVPDYDKPLTADSAAQFLLRDQYVAFPDDDRHDFLVEAAETVFTKLTSGKLAAPRVIADTLTPAVHERRLLLNSFRPAEQAVFTRLALDGALPAVDGDFLSVRASNRGLSKIDALMKRTIDYDVELNPATGQVHSTVTVTVTNGAPAEGLPYVVIGNHLGQPSGTNSTTVAVYTPLQLVEVTRDGAPIPRGASQDFDRNRYTALLDVPAGATTRVVFELEGRLDLRHGYHLDVVPQPLVNADQLRVTATGAPGWIVSGRRGVAAELRETQHLDVELTDAS